jgi:hypothetical protein
MKLIIYSCYHLFSHLTRCDRGFGIACADDSLGNAMS